MRPLEAFDALTRFAQRRGEAALRLAMHAAVPQSFRPELLHLIRLNFVPEAAEDAAVEADVLLAPFCENLGAGYFQIDSEVRHLLLDHLGHVYANEPVLRAVRVANLLLAYVDQTERSSLSANDRLRREFMETQRWVALAFAHPEEAAVQLAEALRAAEDHPALGAHLHLGGVAHAVAIPLAHHPDLLAYASGLQALSNGEVQAARALLAPMAGTEIVVGGITLRPARLLRGTRSGNASSARARSVEAARTPPAEAAEPPISPIGLTAGEIWSRILDGARTALPEQAFRTWLAPTQAVAISQDLLVVSTPNPSAVEWVEDKYAELLTGIGEQLFGKRFTLTVQFLAAKNAPPVPPLIEPVPPPVEGPASPTVSVGPGVDISVQQGAAALNSFYTFDRFVIGNNNQLAAAAAHAVAQAPGRQYNPLYIYGGVGLGKTHLMHAIGHAILERDPGKRVKYLSSERFTNELVSAIQEGSMAEFRRLYRQIDLLLVDDIQFLEGKERTQEEFFHTFNALHDAQRQIVLTSGRPPKDTGLEDRLVSRFEWGLVTDIKPPDFETRMAILRRKVEEDALVIHDSQDVLTFIAHSRTSSVRELEGAVIKLLAYSSLTGRPIDLGLAQEALGGALRPSGGAKAAMQDLTPERVRDRVAEAWGTSPEALQSKKRTKDLTIPRQVAMFLTRELFDLPLVEIGRLFGGRDHSSVIHSIAKVEEDMTTDASFRQRVDAIRQSLR
jgi:chromosomal replication initiator protein